METTIKDVAREAKVSIATVSRVFNNPEKVSETTKNAVLEAAERLNYNANVMARCLITKSSRNIGIIVPDIDNIFFPGVVSGIEDYCSSKGYLSFVCNTYHDTKKEISYINALLSQYIDGVVFIGGRPTDPHDNAHIVDLGKKIPVVLIFDDIPGDNICSIYTDEVLGASKAVQYLYSLGHRKIAFFSSADSNSTYGFKQKGYEKALTELGLPVQNRYIFKNPPYIKGGYESMAQMFKKIPEADRPTAAFAVSDQVALGAYRYCNEHNVKIPDDFGIVGFSGTKFVMDAYGKFVTIDQMPYEAGKLAAGTLIKMIKGDKLLQRRIVMEPKLVISD